jgi:5'(3')-deoxyribonucleotidase
LTVPTVFLDLDGVLADLQRAAFAAHDFPWPDPWPDGAGGRPQWHMHEIAGVSAAQFWLKLNTHEFWSSLPKTPEADQILGAAEEYFGPRNVYLLTSPSASPWSLSGKYAWVEAHYPGYLRRLIPTPAKFLLSAPGRVLIDDSDDHCEGWVRDARGRPRGGEAFLLPRPWNSAAGGDALGELCTFLVRESQP